MKKIAVSGGFDPIHIGHLQMLDEAKISWHASNSYLEFR